MESDSYVAVFEYEGPWAPALAHGSVNVVVDYQFYSFCPDST
jgi:hypothetical protein